MQKLLGTILLVLVSFLPAQADRLFINGLEENCLLTCVWDESVGSPVIITSQTHSGTYALESSPSAGEESVSRVLPSTVTSATHFHRINFYVAAWPLDSSTRDIFDVDNLGASQSLNFSLRDNSVDGSQWRTRLRNGATGSSINGTYDLSLATWYRIEIRHLVHETAGDIESRLYIGESTTSEETLLHSSVDTLSSSIQRFNYGLTVTDSTAVVYFDDIAVNDAVGSAPFNTWLGPGKTAYQEAASDNSTTWERIPTDTTNWDRVDDLPGAPDDSTTYTSEAVTLNSVDRLNAGTLPAEVTSDATIISVNVFAKVGSDQASAAAMRLKLWEEDASLTNGPTVATGLNGWRIMDTDEVLVFDASGKTKANIESFDYGYENITDLATRERRITVLGVNVEWLEAVAGGVVPRRRVTKSD